MNGAHYQIEQSILSGNSLNFVCMCHLKRSHSVDVIAMMHISHTNTHMHTTFKIQCRMHHLDALHFPSYSIFCCRFYGTENKKIGNYYLRTRNNNNLNSLTKRIRNAMHSSILQRNATLIQCILANEWILCRPIYC